MANTLAQKLAISHLNNLPDDLLPYLGLRYLTHFYQFIYSSPLEKIIIQKSATCILTYNAKSLWRRAILRTLPSFIFSIAHKLRYKKFRECLWSSKQHPHPSPQIAFMFSNEKGKGHGSELLRNLNLSPLYVKTLTGGRAEHFYKKNGFIAYDSFEFAKRKYTMLVRIRESSLPLGE